MTDAPRVAFQGEPGAFSEEAVLAFFGEAADARPVPTWRAVFEAVAAGADDAGVVAIESSLAGSIRETYDLLSEFYDAGVRIVGEVSVPVRLALVALPGQSARRDRARLQPRPGARPGRRVPPQPRLAGHDDLQHRRSGADDRRPARAAGGRHRVTPGRRPLRRSRSSPTTSRAATRTGRGSRSWAASGDASAGWPAGVAVRARRRSSSPSATCPGRFIGVSARSRRAASTCRASSRARHGRRAGSTTSGSTSTPTRPTRRAPPRSTSFGRDPDGAGARQLRPGRGGLSD